MQILSAATVTVPVNAVILTVTGTFTVPYQVVGFGPSWPTEVKVSNKTPTSFLLTFTNPAPANSVIDYSVVLEVAAVPPGTGTLAGDIITSVRDLIPDPVYASDGVTPMPDGNGQFRASTLYRWLNDAVKALNRACGSFIEDWIALPQTGYQPWYSIPIQFINLQSGFSNQWPLTTLSLLEEDFIWPSSSQSVAQSLWGYYRKKSDHLEFGLWPIPEATDPVTTLSGNISAVVTSTLALASTANFLSFGYVLIDQEIIQYQRLNVTPNTVSVLSRGVCGTSAAAHSAGASVFHLGLWLKGQRTPAPVVNSHSTIEIPPDLTMYLEKYVLSNAREGEQEERAARLMKEFDDKCKEIRADPTRKESTWQLQPYGSSRLGPIYGRSYWGVVLP